MLKFKILGIVYLPCLPFPPPEHGVWSNALNNIWDYPTLLHQYSHQSPPSWNGTLKNVQNTGSCNPSWLFHHFYIPHYTLYARYFKAPSSLDILWFPHITNFSLKKHSITSPIAIPLPLDEYFWNLTDFCKRQNWNIPEATNTSMHIISFFFLHQKLCFS